MTTTTTLPTPTQNVAFLNALRAARGLAPRPVPGPGGLLEWAHEPHRYADPLPALEARQTRGRGSSARPAAWPVGLLPGQHIASDLAARGVTYRRGVGYAVEGRSVEPTDVALMVADVLDDAAHRLPDSRLALIRAERDSTDDPDVYDLTDSMLKRASALDYLEDMPEHRRDRYDQRNALAATATDIRVGSGAKRAALDVVRRFLPSGEPTLDHDAASAFLGRYDAAEEVRRADLGRDYAAAGRPGALDASALYTLASERWGRPVKRGGHFTYTPSPSAMAVARRGGLPTA